jgi:hypothetical protein
MPARKSGSTQPHPPGYSLALDVAIVSTADISYITFADTPNVYATIAALPPEGILVRSTEWIKYKRVDVGPTVRRLAVIQTRLFHDPTLAGLITSQGWATSTDIDGMVKYIQEWAERPDAFLAIIYCAAVGWAE